jgi:hypothetical protein
MTIKPNQAFVNYLYGGMSPMMGVLNVLSPGLGGKLMSYASNIPGLGAIPKVASAVTGVFANNINPLGATQSQIDIALGLKSKTKTKTKKKANAKKKVVKRKVRK